MRLPSTLLLLLTPVVSAKVQNLRNTQDARSIPESDVLSRRLNTEFSCFGDHNFDLYFKGKCTYNELVARMDVMVQENLSACNHTAAEEVMFLLGYTDYTDVSQEADAREDVKQLCKNAMDLAANDPGKMVPWEDISGYGANFDQNFFDGKTFWNEEVQTDIDTIVPGLASNRLDIDAERVDDFYETVAERVPFAWPETVTSLENCEIRAAMCCWVSDRQANDNNGNCRTPYDERCANADPSANTELCAVDHARHDFTPSSSANDGLSLFPLNSEGAVHCHGMAWSNDDMEADARYRGNNLFYISMYDHMYNRGYVRNVPGAPMCGCVENMPVVERADCTEINALEIWKFGWDDNNGFSASLDRTEIDFNACRNNDLRTHYSDLRQDDHATLEEEWLLERTVVGRNRCNEATNAMMFDKGYDEHYPNVGFTDAKGELYSIKAYSGTNSGISYLHSTGGGALQLQATYIDDKSKWRIALGKDDNMYNIRPKPNAAGLLPDKQYLGTDYYGRTLMTQMNTGTGREMWHFRPIVGLKDTYNIIVTGGTRIGETYLSTNSNGDSISLYHEDDESGRQRWVIEKLADSFDLASLVVRRNVALGKPATQSSVGWGGYPWRAVDGKTSGNWRDGSVTHTMKDTAPWWKVDLGNSFNIEQIYVSLRTDCCTSRSNEFSVQVFNDVGEAKFNFTQTGILSASTLIDVVGPGGEVIVGSKVKVSIPGYDYLSLAEVQVYAEDTL